MTESESVALPLGDAALTDDIIADSTRFVKCFFAFSYIFFEFFNFIPLPQKNLSHVLNRLRFLIFPFKKMPVFPDVSFKISFYYLFQWVN